jgi:hypothetical protein
LVLSTSKIFPPWVRTTDADAWKACKQKKTGSTELWVGGVVCMLKALVLDKWLMDENTFSIENIVVIHRRFPALLSQEKQWWNFNDFSDKAATSSVTRNMHHHVDC